MGKDRQPTLGDARVLGLIWKMDCIRRPVTYQAAVNLDRRFSRRFKEIEKRMENSEKKYQNENDRMNDPTLLDSRSTVLYERCQKEWDSIQPTGFL